MVGPYLLREMEEQVVKIKQNLKASQDRQKSYVDKCKTHREFKVGDHVFLKVKSRKISLRLGNCSKLASRYYGSFEILERIGPIATCFHFLHPYAFIMCFIYLCLKRLFLMLII
jgi:hypothetical protein